MENYKRIILCINLMVTATFVITCAAGVADHQGENTMVKRGIEKVLKEHTTELMSIPGVVGTAQGLCDGKPCIKVYVVKKTPELDKKIPKNIGGFPVSIEETGEIRPLPKSRN